jgi:hypothetical protein
MQIVPSSLLALAAVLALMVMGPYRALWVFLATTPFAAAAAFNLPAAGGASILVSDLAAMALFAATALSAGGLALMAGTARPFQPGFWMLALALFAIFATLMFPSLFRGQTEVFSIARINNESGIVSVPLKPSTGNLTQLFRIMLGVIAFFALATVFRVRPDGRMVLGAMTVVTAVHVALGWLDVVSFAAGLSQLLEPIRSANYAILFDHRMVGLKRMIGGFPEASSFGYFSLGLTAFWLHYWISAPMSRRAPWMLALVGIVLLRSTSSAAYVSLVLFLATYALVMLALSLRARVGRRGAAIAAAGAVAVWAAAMAIFLAYHMVEPVTAFLDRALFDKLDGASGVERMSWNAQAFVNFRETWFLGAGLGSVRASNWLMAVLASLGVIGAVLFAAFFATLARAPLPKDDLRGPVVGALKAAAGAFLISAMLTASTPDLGVIFFAVCGLIAGLSRGAQLESRPN